MNMKIINKERILLELTSNELASIVNSLNEVCNGLKIANFDQKLGTSKEEVNKYLDYLIELHKSFETDNPSNSIDM